jgi:hypothetical protein
MRKVLALGALLALASLAQAAPNVTNVSQKGSLLIFPDVRIDDEWNTVIRIQNDGNLAVDVLCYWMDGNKNRVDFRFSITKTQAVWFDARSGSGTYQVNKFPQVKANGKDNPYLVSPGKTESTDGAEPYLQGMLICWAVSETGRDQVKWNHLSGNALVYSPLEGAYDYAAYAFFVPNGHDKSQPGEGGGLVLDGVVYDSCPLYQIGQFSPEDAVDVERNGPLNLGNRLAVSACDLRLNQDWIPTYTKLQFDVWNEYEVKYTGAFECSDSWHETSFGDDLDAGAGNLDFDTLGTWAGRYRVQGVSSSQCPGSVATGVIAVQASWWSVGQGRQVSGTPLTSAGKKTGKIVFDSLGAVPEDAR